MENGIGKAFRAEQVKPGVAVNFIIGIDDIAQYSEQVLANTANHFVVNKCIGRCIFYREFYPALLLHNADFKVFVTL